MGIIDFIYSSTDYLKGSVPDLTPVKNTCRSSYQYGWSAVNAVKSTVVYGVNNYYPDTQTIGRVATKIGRNTVNYGLHETVKSLPGGNAFDKIVLGAFRDEMALQAKVSKAEKESSGRGKSLEQAKMPKVDKEFASENAACLDPRVIQKSEDVIRIFMMNGFMDKNIFDALIVPVTRPGKKQN